MGACAGAMAQSAGPNGGQITPPPAGQHNHKAKANPLLVLFKSMHLTPAQQKQIRDQQKSNEADLKAFRKANPADKAGIKAESEKLKANMDTALQTILNKDQLATWEAWKSASNLKGFLADGRALRAAKLSPDQMKQIRALKGQSHTEALMGIAKDPANQSAVDASKAKASADYQAGLAKILTSDQLAAYQSAPSGKRK